MHAGPSATRTTYLEVVHATVPRPGQLRERRQGGERDGLPLAVGHVHVQQQAVLPVPDHSGLCTQHHGRSGVPAQGFGRQAELSLGAGLGHTGYLESGSGSFD